MSAEHDATTAEGEVAEYILGLDSLGMGGKAQALYVRALVRDIRPLLLRQRAALRRAGALGRWRGADEYRDAGWSEEQINAEWAEVWRHLKASKAAPAQAAELSALDAELAAAWGRLLEQLRILWLTEGGP